MADEILTFEPVVVGRQAAIQLGLKKYFTGVPCLNGHVDYRYLSRGCVSCSARSSEDALAKHAKQSAEYRGRHREKEKARHARYSAKNKEKISAKNSAWRAKSEGTPLAAKAWREKNRERAIELVRAWQAKHKDKLRVYKQNRRARKIANGGQLSRGIVQKLWASQRGKCACCGSPLDKNFHLDHIMPLALGGQNSDDNVQLLTQRCNAQKGAKHPIEFMQQRGFLL